MNDRVRFSQLFLFVKVFMISEYQVPDFSLTPITSYSFSCSSSSIKAAISNLKKCGMSITGYLDKMKSIAEALEAIEQPISEYDLCN